MVALAYANLTAADGPTSTAQPWQTFETKGAKWMYGKAGAAISANQAVYFLQDGTFALVTHALVNAGGAGSAAIPAVIGVAQFAFNSGDYGWVWVGPGYLREDDKTTFQTVVVDTTSKLTSKIYTTSTAGEVSDVSTSVDLISGLVLSASQAGLAHTAVNCQAVRTMAVNV